jgi:hypothetical protein
MTMKRERSDHRNQDGFDLSTDEGIDSHVEIAVFLGAVFVIVVGVAVYAWGYS